jgi:hypothetical protein
MKWEARMPSISGLIGGVLGGAADAYSEYAGSELKNKQRIDLEKSLSEVLYDRDQRIKEADLMRNRGEEERKLSPDYIKKVSAAKVTGQVSELDAASAAGLPQKQATYEADKEKSKYNAMVSSGVPKAKADALMAEWTAAAPQRKLELDTLINNEISKVTTLAGNKEYIKGKGKLDIAESAGNIAEINAREAGYTKRLKNDALQTTKDLERQLGAANENIARELGIPKNKINEEIAFLEDGARRGDKNAISTLARVKPQLDTWKDLNRNLQEWKRNNPSSSSGSDGGGGYAKGDTRVVESGEHKGKTAVFDGTGWKLK